MDHTFVGADRAAPGPRLGPASPGLGPCLGVSRALGHCGGGGPRLYSPGNSADGLKDCLGRLSEKAWCVGFVFLLSHQFLGSGMGLSAALH